MNTKPKYIIEIVIRSIVSLICCLVIGYIFYQSQIFNRHASAFSFPVCGVVGSIFFYTLRINIRNAFAVFLVLFIATSALVTHSTRLIFLLRDILYYGAFASAIFIFFQYFYGKSIKDRWMEPLILSVLVAVIILFAFFLTMSINKAFGALTLSFVFFVAKLYFLIGLGMGVGIVITEEPYRSRILKFFKPDGE
jgi:hypothetical protein